MIPQWGRHYTLHFIDKETSAQRVQPLPKQDQTTGNSEILNSDPWISNLAFLPLLSGHGQNQTSGLWPTVFLPALRKTEGPPRVALICYVAVDKACPSGPQFSLNKVMEVQQQWVHKITLTFDTPGSTKKHVFEKSHILSVLKRWQNLKRH